MATKTTLECSTVILVDDDTNIGDLLRFEFENKFKNKVVNFINGNSAIRYLKVYRRQVNLIVSDLNMPNGTGLDLFSYCSCNLPQTPFIFLTSIDYDPTQFPNLKRLNSQIRHFHKLVEIKRFFDYVEKNIFRSY